MQQNLICIPETNVFFGEGGVPILCKTVTNKKRRELSATQPSLSWDSLCRLSMVKDTRKGPRCQGNSRLAHCPLTDTSAALCASCPQPSASCQASPKGDLNFSHITKNISTQNHRQYGAAMMGYKGTLCLLETWKCLKLTQIRTHCNGDPALD